MIHFLDKIVGPNVGSNFGPNFKPKFGPNFGPNFDQKNGPKAGPTFPIEDAAPPIADIKSKPIRLNTPAPIINKIKYNIKKAKT